MTKEAFIHGIYPRSEALVTATQGLGRGRSTAQEVTALERENRDALIGLQNSEHFTLIEDGKFEWQDIFRPFVLTSQGFDRSQEGEVTRWFDNNSFFRRPIITGNLTPDFNKLSAYFPKTEGGEWKITLPSPFTFAKLCEDRTTGKFEGTLENITHLLGLTINYLQKRGASFIQLNEPYIPYHGSDPRDIKSLIASLRSLSLYSGNARLALHSYFGDSAPLAKQLEEAGVVDAIGVDFLQTQVSDLPSSTHHDLIAGVVDGRNSAVETRQELHPLLDEIQEHSRPATLYITHNTDLEFLPENVANKKVKLIGSLTQK